MNVPCKVSADANIRIEGTCNVLPGRISNSDLSNLRKSSDLDLKTTTATAPNRTKNSFNEYNLFFILERQRLLKLKDPSHTKYLTSASEESKGRQPSNHGYEGIVLPPFPARYQNLVVSDDWFVPKRNKRRSHRKTHGLVSFQELSKNAAKEWKTLDRATKSYLKEVADILRDRHMENMIRSQYLTPKESDFPPIVVSPPASPNPNMQEAQFRRISSYCVTEVDMSDDAIISLWNCI